MKHLVLPDLPPRGETLRIAGTDRHHLVDVRRLAPGDSCHCSDGRGRVASVTITAVTRREVEVLVGEDVEAAHQSGPGGAGALPLFVVYVPLIKGKGFDRLLRQLVELGVDRIVPLVTERCVRRPSTRNERNLPPRYEEILREACKQCGRSRLPELAEVRELRDILSLEEGGGIVFHELAGSVLAPEDLIERLADTGNDRLAILTGPEGGLTEREVELLEQAGWAVRALPTPVLRAETAASAALAIVRYIVSGYTCAAL